MQNTLPHIPTRKPNIVHDPYKFKGFGIHPSECKVEIWADETKAIILFTDLGKGTSVTNAAEDLVEKVYNKHLASYAKENCTFFETYDRFKLENVDFIIPTWDGNKVTAVSWKPLAQRFNSSNPLER